MTKKGEGKVVRGAGDNGPENGIDSKKITGFVVSIEKIEAKKAQILQELRETYADAKAVGYDTKLLRRAVRDRAQEPEKRQAQEELYELYKSALGMLDDE